MILSFNEFINESYLKSGRPLLYNYTNRLKDIMKSDMLKTSKPPAGDDAICFTRSVYFEEHSKPVRLVFDSDLLRIGGYKTYPIDEVGISASDTKHLKAYTKANPNFPVRKTTHRLKNFKQELVDFYGGLEWEYEERCYKDIKNLGKYLIAIDITKEELKRNYEEIKKYLDKYPHIEIYELNMKKLWDRRNKIDFNEYYNELVNKVKQTV